MRPLEHSLLSLLVLRAAHVSVEYKLRSFRDKLTFKTGGAAFRLGAPFAGGFTILERV